MRDVRKWNMYVHGLQAHFGLCQSHHTKESMGFLPALIPPQKYNKILNIGVGEGLETSILRDLGYTPTGIISGEANKKWASEQYKGIEFVECDMHDLPFTNASFDAIYTNQVFEHAYAPFIFLLECFCVLRPGGLFYICTPAFSERHSENDPQSLEASHISHHHPSMFSPNIYRQLFEKTGFEVLEQKDDKMSFLLRRGPLTNMHSDFTNILDARRSLQ